MILKVQNFSFIACGFFCLFLWVFKWFFFFIFWEGVVCVFCHLRKYVEDEDPFMSIFRLIFHDIGCCQPCCQEMPSHLTL